MRRNAFGSNAGYAYTGMYLLLWHCLQVHEFADKLVKCERRNRLVVRANPSSYDVRPKPRISAQIMWQSNKCIHPRTQS